MKKYLAIFILASLTISLNAQSVSYLNLSTDSRSLSMGGASVALTSNVFASYTNPASMSMSNEKMAVALSYLQWQPKASNNTLFGFSGFYRIGDKLAVGINAGYFTYQPYNITGVDGIVTGTFSPKDYSAAVGISYMIIENLSVGANIRYINSDMDGTKAGTAFAADVALMYKINSLTLGLSATNLGSKINYGDYDHSLPAMGKLGAAYGLSFDNSNIIMSVEGDYLLFKKSIMAGIGLEYSFKEMVSIRAGYHYGDAIKAIPSYTSFGIGFKVVGISLNGAYILAPDSPLNNSFSLSLGYSF